MVLLLSGRSTELNVTSILEGYCRIMYGHSIRVHLKIYFDSTCSVTADMLSSRMESVSIKTESEGDMAGLDPRARISLAMLLDPPKEGADWL